MTGAVIGLDTSCYTTSCAAVTVEGEIIASCRKLLPVKTGERGLRQSEALFQHVRALPERFAANPNSAIDDLLPWAEDVQQLC